ncbi:hypothetical protein B7463_g12694, partial [Scytalidium lignicola]
MADALPCGGQEKLNMADGRLRWAPASSKQARRESPTSGKARGAAGTGPPSPSPSPFRSSRTVTKAKKAPTNQQQSQIMAWQGPCPAGNRMQQRSGRQGCRERRLNCF